MANGAVAIANLSACTAPAETDKFVIQSTTNSNTQHVQVVHVLQNSAVNISSNVITTNIMIITGNATPANNTDIPTGASNGALWSDGSYIYYYNGTEIKRVVLSTF